MFIPLLLFLTFSVQSWLNIQGFIPCKNGQAHRSSVTTYLNSYQSKGSQEEYERQLIEAAKDPAAFEAFVRGKNLPNRDEDRNRIAVPEESSQVRKYQRIEEWDAEQSQESMTWENRVQNDGRRYGNQFLQNEILRKFLKSF
jgi:hypothetical protein